MVRRNVTGNTTFGEFMELIQENQKADLLDGVIYLASPENTGHNDLLRWLTLVLGVFIEERRLGQLTINKVAYRLSDRTAPEPDLAFVSASRVSKIKLGYVEGPPDLAIEIISPDSIDRDYENKRLRYEEGGVKEYWIIDPLDETVLFLVSEGGKFIEQPLSGHMLESRVLPGLKLDTRWLFQRPLPSTMPIVRSLLGE